MQIQRAAISHTLRFRLSGSWPFETMGWPRDGLRARVSRAALRTRTDSAKRIAWLLALLGTASHRAARQVW